jgi:hypothetical protein
MKHSLSLVHSSPVVALSDRNPPRIGIARSRPQPAAAIATYTRDENRAFMNDIREQSRLVRWEVQYMRRHATELANFPAVAEVCQVALWHAANKPARHWPHTGPLCAGEEVIHDGDDFTHRGERWLWRLVERAKPAGLWLEVRGVFTASAPLIARMPWSATDAAA